MLLYRIGNLLNAPQKVIAHQVNCQGKMGSGVAKVIRDKYPKVYETYLNTCAYNLSNGNSPEHLAAKLILLKSMIIRKLFNKISGRTTLFSCIYFRRRKGFLKQKEYDEKKREYCNINQIKLIEIPYTNLRQINNDCLKLLLEEYL